MKQIVDNSDVIRNRKTEPAEAELVQRRFSGATPKPRVTRALRPLANRIVIEPVPGSEFYDDAGLIAKPDQAKERPHFGKVVAHGPGSIHPVTGQLMPVSVVAGQTIAHGKYAGTEMPLNEGGPIYLVLREEEIIGIIEEHPACICGGEQAHGTNLPRTDIFCPACDAGHGIAK